MDKIKDFWKWTPENQEAMIKFLDEFKDPTPKFFVDYECSWPKAEKRVPVQIKEIDGQPVDKFMFLKATTLEKISDMVSLKTKAEMLGLGDFNIVKTGDGESEWEVETEASKMEAEQTEMFDTDDGPTYGPTSYASQFAEARKNFHNDIKRLGAEQSEMFQFKQMFTFADKHNVEDPIETHLLPPSRTGVNAFTLLVERMIDA